MDKDSSQRQIFQMQEKAFKEMVKALKETNKLKFSDFDIKTIEGKPGYTPIKGKDYFTPTEKKAMTADVFSMVKIPKAIPGKDAVVDYLAINKVITDSVSKIKIPKAIPGKDGEDGKDAVVDYNKIVSDAIGRLPKVEKVDYDTVDTLVKEGLEKYQSIRPLTNSAGPRTRLGEMVDVDIEGITNSQGLFWNSTTERFEPGAGGGGGDVATDTIWDTKGDVAIGTGADTAVVIGVGTDGQVLTADSAEASGVKWSTIAGTGDMVLADVQTVTGAKTFNNGTLLLRNVADTFNGVFSNTNTADRTYTLQDGSGTFAFTSDLHSAVTVTDTAEIDLTLTGQDIKADIITGSVDVLKLDAGVQTSLGLADSASQDIHANIAALDLVSGTNTGDQTTIVGITGTKAQFDTAVTDGNFMYIGDAPTSHTHVEADITDLQAYILADSTDTLTNKSIDADGTGNVITNIGFPEFDTDVADTMLFTAGAYLDQPSVSVASDGTTITLSIEQDGGGDLRVLFLTGKYLWDTSPAATVTLTAGSNASPQMNYVYIDEATKTLQISTSGFPVADIVRVATVLCQSATSIQTDSPYKLHAWTDHMASSTCGHLSHINAWIRSQAATWIDGAVTTPTITTNAGTEDNVNVAISSGNVLQLHSQTFPAHDTAVSSDVHIVNKSGAAFTAVTDLNAADEDDAGNAITNNKWTNLVLWGAVNENNGKVFLNLPSAFHGSAGAATEDTEGYSNYSIPSDFTGVGFLIARLTLKYTTASGGTWAMVENKDLRGQLPTIVAGGGGSAGSEFPDNTFRIQDEGDVTKQIAFEASGLTTGTTRTLTVQDSDGTIALTSDLHDAVTLAGEDFLTIAGQVITANPIDLDNLSATGTASASTFLRGDNTWATPAGSGDVSKVGTPVDNQIGVWTGDGTIEGDTALTFDTTTDTLAIGASGKLNFGAVNILSDSAGTMTLSNIDALDATTEATIESAIDTLANLTSATSLSITESQISDLSHNTLDAAYDEGGAGLGRSITADSGAVEITVPDTSNNVGLSIIADDTTNYPIALEVGQTSTAVSSSTLVQFASEDGNYSDWAFNVASNGHPAINLQSTGGTLASPIASSSSAGGTRKSNIITYAYNSTPAQLPISYIETQLMDGTAGSEDSKIKFHTRSAGTLGSELVIGDGINGIEVGTASFAGILSSSGNQDLVLQTGNATTGTITLTDGANGNIDLAPNGTGDVLLGNFTFDADQTVGAGQDNYVMTYDNATGKVSLEVAPGAAGGDNVSIDGVSVTDPDFVSTGDIDFVDTANTVTANLNAGVVDATEMHNDMKYETIGIVIDGAGSAITTGIKGDRYIPYDCTIQSAELVLDQSGSIVIDVWKDTYANYPATDVDSITASAPPTVTTATKSQDATLTGWTTTLARGDYLRFNVDSITTATRAVLTLTVLRT